MDGSGVWSFDVRAEQKSCHFATPPPSREQVSYLVVEAGALDIEQRVRPVLGRGEMCVHCVDLETGAVEHRGHRVGEVVIAEPEPVHPRVYF